MRQPSIIGYDSGSDTASAALLCAAPAMQNLVAPAWLPCAATWVQAMRPCTRAELVREVADALRDLWAGDAFRVPTELLILVSQRP